MKKKKQKKTQPNPNKGGGVKGHKGHHRSLLDSEEVDEIVRCKLPKFCSCKGTIKLKAESMRHQVHELLPMKLHVTEYRLEKGFCTCCGQHQIASLPKGVTWGITGPRLTSLMSHMVSKYKLSCRELQTFLKPITGVYDSFKLNEAILMRELGASIIIPPPSVAS